MWFNREVQYRNTHTKKNGLVAKPRIAAAFVCCTTLYTFFFCVRDQNKGLSIKKKFRLALQQILPIMLLAYFYCCKRGGVRLWMGECDTVFPNKASSKCLSLQGDNKHSSTPWQRDYVDVEVFAALLNGCVRGVNSPKAR